MFAVVVYNTECHQDGDVPPDWCDHFEGDEHAFNGLPTVDNLDELDKLFAECQNVSLHWFLNKPLLCLGTKPV